MWLDREKIPVDGKSNLLLRYRGKKHTFPYVSAADVLTGQVPTEKLRDKIVFVGTNALGTREVVATPLDTLFAGVEVQATVADNLLQGDFVRRPELGNAIESYDAVMAGVAVAVLVARVGLSWGALGVVGVSGRLVDRRRVAALVGRRLPVAAAADVRLDLRGRRHDAREVLDRAAARRHRARTRRTPRSA